MSAPANSGLVSVLHEAQAAPHRPNRGFPWSKWDDALAGVAEIDSHIAANERGDLSGLSDFAFTLNN